jgi:hypothetical protein
MLEDKTIAGCGPANSVLGDEESGLGTGRLYGICVIHPRVLNTVIDQHSQPSSAESPSTTVSLTTKLSYEFESMVCYAFITRFPLFDFFFQGIFDDICVCLPDS